MAASSYTGTAPLQHLPMDTEIIPFSPEEKQVGIKQEVENQPSRRDIWDTKKRRRPLSRFVQAEDSPGFYLSLSDLMSLLLVFFVLIFSLTKYQPAVEEERSISETNSSRMEIVHQKSVISLPDMDLFSPSAMLVSIVGGQAITSEAKQVSGKPQSTTAKKEPEAPWIEHSFEAPEIREQALSSLLRENFSALPEQSVPTQEARLEELGREVESHTPVDVEVTRQAGTLLVKLPESIAFDLAQAEIKPQMLPVLDRIGKLIARHNGYQVVVTGHTDNLPIMNTRFASNWELSAARAASVGRALLANGLDESRLTIKGLANQKPVQSNDTMLGRQANRRVEIELRPTDGAKPGIVRKNLGSVHTGARG